MKSIPRHIINLAVKKSVFRISVIVTLLTTGIWGQTGPSLESSFQKCWEYSYDGTIDIRIETDGNSAYSVRNSSVIDAVSLDSGKLAWSNDAGGKIESNLIAVGGNLILIRRSVSNGSGPPDSADVRAISAATGITKWNTSLPKGASYSLGIVGEKVLAFSEDGSMQLLSAADGTAVWNRKTNVGIESVIFDSDRAFFITGEMEIRSLTSAGGESAFVAKSPYTITALRAHHDNNVVWGDERGNITSLGITSNRTEWQFKSGAKINEIIRANGYLLASSNDNFVYAISPESGTRIWKKRFPGRITSMVPLSDEAVLIQTLGESTLVILDAKTGKTLDQISFSGQGEIPLGSRSVGAGTILVVSNTSLYRFSRNGCSAKIQSGPR